MAKKETAVSNEEIVAALLSNSTIKQAAAAAGISTRTLYDRMGSREFQSDYAAARAAVVRQSVFNINSKITAAIETTAEIMQDKETNPAVRLQAAQTILANAVKFSERLQAEDTAAADAAKNPFSIFG